MTHYGLKGALIEASRLALLGKRTSSWVHELAALGEAGRPSLAELSGRLHVVGEDGGPLLDWLAAQEIEELHPEGELTGRRGFASPEGAAGATLPVRFAAGVADVSFARLRFVRARPALDLQRWRVEQPAFALRLGAFGTVLALAPDLELTVREHARLLCRAVALAELGFPEAGLEELRGIEHTGAVRAFGLDGLSLRMEVRRLAGDPAAALELAGKEAAGLLASASVPERGRYLVRLALAELESPAPELRRLQALLDDAELRLRGSTPSDLALVELALARLALLARRPELAAARVTEGLRVLRGGTALHLAGRLFSRLAAATDGGPGHPVKLATLAAAACCARHAGCAGDLLAALAELCRFEIDPARRASCEAEAALLAQHLDRPIPGRLAPLLVELERIPPASLGLLARAPARSGAGVVGAAGSAGGSGAAAGSGAASLLDRFDDELVAAPGVSLVQAREWAGWGARLARRVLSEPASGLARPAPPTHATLDAAEAWFWRTRASSSAEGALLARYHQRLAELHPGCLAGLARHLEQRFRLAARSTLDRVALQQASDLVRPALLLGFDLECALLTSLPPKR